MRILLTGASGLLGSKICTLSNTKKHIIFTGYNVNIPNCGTPVQINLAQPGQTLSTLEKLDPEIIVHCAALTNVDYCEEHPDQASQINTNAIEEIIQFCREKNVFLLFMSTDYVFNGDTGNYSETDKPNPVNHYGYTKLQSEQIIQKNLEDYCIARTSVIYGSRPATGKINFALWLYNQLLENRPIQIVIDQWNSPTLNTNLAEMLLEIIDKRITGILHTAGANRISRYDFSEILAEEFGFSKSLITASTMDQINWKAKRPIDTSLDVSLASQTLSHNPQDILESIKQLYNEISNKS